MTTRADYAQSVTHLVGFPYMRWWHQDALADRRIAGLPEKLRGAYPWILSVAAASPLPGALIDYDERVLDPKTLAAAAGLGIPTVRAFLAAAEDRGILDRLDDDTPYFPAFVSRQIKASDVERARLRKERARTAAEAKWAKERASADAQADANGSASAYPDWSASA